MKLIRYFSAFAVAFVLALAPIQTAHSSDRPSYLPSTAEDIARKEQFDALLGQRSQPPIAGQTSLAEQLLPYLDDPFVGLRVRAAQALGELRDPIAKEPLEARLALMRQEPIDRALEIPLLTLQLALGSIVSRDLHGQAKLDAALSYTQYKWANVVEWSTRINSEENRYSYAYSDTNIVLAFIVDIVYEMGKQGEPIKELVGQLTLSDAQKVYLQAASLSTKEEVQLEMAFLVDKHVYVDAYQKDGLELTRHLVTLKPEITQALLARLEDMKQHPGNYYGNYPSPGRPGYYFTRMTYSALFTVVGATHDLQMVPLLKYFERIDNPGVRADAALVREHLEGYKPEIAPANPNATNPAPASQP